MNNLTQEFAQFKAYLMHRWLKCPGCQSHQAKRLAIPELGENLLECGHCNHVWRWGSDAEQQEPFQWQHIVRGQQIVNHWAHRTKPATCP